MKFLKDNSILDIAEASSENAQEILEYLKQVGGESDNLIMDRNGISLTLDQEREYLKRNLDSLNNKTFVGRVNGKIVSIAGITGSPRERVKHNVVLGVSVLKDFWNKGVATHMMQYVVNYCRLEQSILNITLEVKEDNSHAIALYESLGFRKIGQFSRKIKIDDQYFITYIYELLL